MRANTMAWLSLTLFLWLSVTKSSTARGENSRWDDSGLMVRGGSAVGFTELADHRFTTLGGQIAAGYRLGPIAVEAEYEATEILRYVDLGNELRGQMRRLGAAGRLYFAKIGNTEGSSLVLLYAEVAVGRQKGSLQKLGFARNDVGGGLGWLFDHKVSSKGASGIERIGWHFGWRLTRSSKKPPEAMARIVCGKTCPEIMPESPADVNLTMGSSLSLSW